MIEYYPLVRGLHVGCVVLSLSLFALRGALMLAEAPIRRHRVLRVAPHLIDTVLLGSALSLSVMLHQYPFVHGWLTAKVLALLAYIVLGSIALKRGRTRRIRVLALLGATLSAAFIVGAALNRSPWGLLVLLS